MLVVAEEHTAIAEGPRRALKALGVRCSRVRVGRLMRKEMGSGALPAGPQEEEAHYPPGPARYSRSRPGEEKLRRPSTKSALDGGHNITYLHTDEGFLYLAFILDVYSRRVVGWSMASHLRSELVADALQMALHRSNPSIGLIHHSDRGDRGAPCTALSFGKRLEEAGIVPSMGRAGSALDNAISESFVSTLKSEIGVSHYPSPAR